METFYTVTAELDLDHLRHNLFELGIAFAQKLSEAKASSDPEKAVAALQAKRLVINTHVTNRRHEDMYVAQSHSVYLTMVARIQEHIDYAKRQTSDDPRPGIPQTGFIPHNGE